MKVPRFDIFSGTEKNAQWIEVVDGLDAASQRMEFYAAKCPGKYFLFDSSEHTIACNIDTSPSASPTLEGMDFISLSCQSCGSANQKQFESEMDIHFPKLRDVKRRPVLLFPMIVVCLDCGRAGFIIPTQGLNSLDCSAR